MPLYYGTDGKDFIHSSDVVGSYPGYNEVLVDQGGSPNIQAFGGDDVIAIDFTGYITDAGTGNDLFLFYDNGSTGYLGYFTGGDGNDTVSNVNATGERVEFIRQLDRERHRQQFQRYHPLERKRWRRHQPPAGIGRG